LERFSALDTSTLRRLAALLENGRMDPAGTGSRYLHFLRPITESDIASLREAERSYGNSWKLRGGVDTFHMLRRKWERIEARVAADASTAGGSSPYDIFEHIAADRRTDGFIDDVRDLRRYLMLVEAEMIARKAGDLRDSGRGYLDQLATVARNDMETIEKKERAYGNSWKRGGGIGAFMMLARKWDRLKERVVARLDAAQGAAGASRDNVFEHIEADHRAESVIDDIRGLRQYLLLVEGEMVARGDVRIAAARNNPKQAHRSADARVRHEGHPRPERAGG
jgi:hypothetical protein